MSTSRPTIIGIGELLWDRLPAGDQLGGAPANFSYHGSLLGNRTYVLSRVGRDRLGDLALARMRLLAQPVSFVQIDSSRPTGTVAIDVDSQGQPAFRIAEQTAWDYLEYSDDYAALAGRADAVCFGSLAQRSPMSRDTIRRFIQAMPPGALRVFDVNLRPPFISKTVIEESLFLAQIAKLNDAEIVTLARMFGIDENDEVTYAQRMLQRFELELVAVTRGAGGCILVSADEIVERPGYEIEVADTVGAGDAFTAALVHHYLSGSPLEVIGEAANLLGATVASLHGATPPIDPDIIRSVAG